MLTTRHATVSPIPLSARNIYFFTNTTDINECLSNNGGCSQICTNTNGHYVCSCQTGFMSYVIDDNSTCNGLSAFKGAIISVITFNR